MEDAAKAAATAKGTTTLPPAKSIFQPWNQLLMNAGILTADEGELSQKLYNYLSNAAAHRLSSGAEQLRVTKNMVIELGLLIVGRVQGLMGGKPTSP